MLPICGYQIIFLIQMSCILPKCSILLDKLISSFYFAFALFCLLMELSCRLISNERGLSANCDKSCRRRKKTV